MHMSSYRVRSRGVTVLTTDSLDKAARLVFELTCLDSGPLSAQVQEAVDDPHDKSIYRWEKVFPL